MVYLKVMSAFVIFFILAIANASVNAETLFTRLECEAMDGKATIWVQSKVIAFDDGKPAIDHSQKFDSQEMVARIMSDVYGETTKTVIIEHAKPFRRTLAEKYGLICHTDIVTGTSISTIDDFKALMKLGDSVIIDMRKDFFNVDLKILVIAYPEE